MLRGREYESRGVQASEAKPALYRGPLSNRRAAGDVSRSTRPRSKASGRKRRAAFDGEEDALVV